MTNTMTAIEIRGKGGPEVLTPISMPIPTPGPGQLLIKVAAAGVNRPDVAQRGGFYPAPKDHSPIPGLEAAGEVAAIGDGVSGFQIGDQVCALLNGGGYAEYAIAQAASTLPVPSNISLTEAAGLPETVFTVWHNVFQRGALKQGEWFLVHGGTSGIGTTAIQLAKASGAKVIATAGSDDKCNACLELGADRAVNYKTEDFVAVCKDVTEGKGINVTLDMVAGDYTDKNIIVAAEDGRIVQIASLQGAQVTINIARLMMKRLTLTGSTLRARSNDFKGQLAREVEQHVWPMLKAGKMKVVMDHAFPLDQAAEAHKRMETSTHIGKIVLTVS